MRSVWLTFYSFKKLRLEGLKLLHFSWPYFLISGRTSVNSCLATFFKNWASLWSSRSSGLPIQVRISIPLSGCLSKLSLILSTITVRLRSRPSRPRSFTNTPSSSWQWCRYNRWEIALPWSGILKSMLESVFCWTPLYPSKSLLSMMFRMKSAYSWAAAVKTMTS